jgi:hypothetical protein
MGRTIMNDGANNTAVWGTRNLKQTRPGLPGAAHVPEESVF